MVLQVKAPATQTEVLGLIPRIHTVEEEGWLLELPSNISTHFHTPFTQKQLLKLNSTNENKTSEASETSLSWAQIQTPQLAVEKPVWDSKT